MLEEKCGLSAAEWEAFWQGKSKPARDEAERQLKRLFAGIKNSYYQEGRGNSWTDWYEKRVEEMAREVVLEDLDGGNVVVNNHGIEVLQTAQLAISDIDTRDKESAIKRTVWLCSREDLSARIYETFGGLRILFTGRERPTSEGLHLLHQTNSDRRYTRICQTSHTYRARLEPKPKRVRVGYTHQVCRFITEVGDLNLFEPLVNLHDRRCCGNGGGVLA